MDCDFVISQSIHQYAPQYAGQVGIPLRQTQTLIDCNKRKCRDSPSYVQGTDQKICSETLWNNGQVDGG